MNAEYPKPDVERVKPPRHQESEHAGDHPGAALHIFRDGEEWLVWLNPDHTPDTGICLAWERSRDAAVATAVAHLEWALDTLQGPAPIGGPGGERS